MLGRLRCAALTAHWGGGPMWMDILLLRLSCMILRAMPLWRRTPDHLLLA